MCPYHSFMRTFVLSWEFSFECADARRSHCFRRCAHPPSAVPPQDTGRCLQWPSEGTHSHAHGQIKRFVRKSKPLFTSQIAGCYPNKNICPNGDSRNVYNCNQMKNKDISIINFKHLCMYTIVHVFRLSELKLYWLNSIKSLKCVSSCIVLWYSLSFKKQHAHLPLGLFTESLFKNLTALLYVQNSQLSKTWIFLSLVIANTNADVQIWGCCGF